ncbi:MAG TPA: NAD(P)/FAD-dependent oxidoreductase, partial [Thermoleophilaceae bacterium]
MSESFDVVVVGSRVAGASLATLLAREGLNVVVVDQTSVDRPVLSSHLIQADSLTFLDRLGVIDAVRRLGVPFMCRADTRLEDLHIIADFPQRPGDLGAAAVIRRHLLDPILRDAAAEAGVDVRTNTKVVGLVRDGDRVAGVRVASAGSEYELHAQLVVGADGRSSTVAKLCEAREYNITENARFYYWTFFEGAAPWSDDTLIFHRWGDQMVWGGPADSGLFLVGVSPEQAGRDEFCKDLTGGLLKYMRTCEPMARALVDARIATKVHGVRKFKAYFREPCGPGWVLIGDAGHFKDPAAGRGIGDAFLQADAMVPAVVAALDGSGEPLDQALARWGEWREHKFTGHYWMADGLGGSGTMPTMGVELVRQLHRAGKTDEYLDLFSHRSRYYDVFTLPRLAAATTRLLARRATDRRALFDEAQVLAFHEGRRRWINKHPDFDSGDPSIADSWATPREEPRARSLASV